MDDVVVAAAAILHTDRLLVAKRWNPAPVAGQWELPGDELREDESGPDALRREFAEEFGLSIDCYDRILSDQRMIAWRIEDGTPVDGVLRVWRCRLPTGRTFNLDAGEPRPNLHEYDSVSWLPLDDFDAVGPWRDADRAIVDAIVAYYRVDPSWPTSG